MKVTIDIPDAVRDSLQQQLGSNLTQAAKEAMAIAWYQDEKLSIGQVAELLGITVYEAEGLMKQHRIEAPYSVEDFERDRVTIERLFEVIVIVAKLRQTNFHIADRIIERVLREDSEGRSTSG